MSYDLMSSYETLVTRTVQCCTVKAASIRNREMKCLNEMFPPVFSLFRSQLFFMLVLICLLVLFFFSQQVLFLKYGTKITANHSV